MIYLLTDGITNATEDKLREVCDARQADLKVIKCGIDNLGDFQVG